MGRWMFSALPFAGSAAILLFSIRGSTIADDIFACTVRALHGDRDHQTFYFFQDFCFYSITAFSFCPLPILSHKLVYVEECMFDTAIEDFDVWLILSELSIDIESESSVATRMELRRERIRCYLEYEYKLETETLELIGTNSIALMKQIMIAVCWLLFLSVRKKSHNFSY